MEPSKILTWCNDKSLDVKHAFVLSAVDVGVSDEDIYKVLDSVKVLGRTKIKGRCLGSTNNTQLILVEATHDLTQIQPPEQVDLLDLQLGPWPIHVVETQSVPASTEEEDFQTKLIAFLANEGKTLDEVKGLFTPTTPMANALDLNAQLVNAISSLVQKCQVSPAEIQSYRKLRLFSGLKPTPTGEEEYEVWAEQTTHMLEEWQCSDTVKKQRVAESLKGPAADIIRFLRVSNPNVTAND